MSTSRTRKRPRTPRFDHSVAKPRGLLHPRVQQVGPEHFGIVCFDCAKLRSKLLLADFYGRVLIPPTSVAHNRPELDAAVAKVRQAFTEHQLHEGLVAIERTGRYHRLVQRTFAAAGFETRILHPFVTTQYRQPVDPGNQTDDTDLGASHRATVTACALVEATREEAWTTLLLLIRQRRDLVRKGAALNCQIRDHLEAALPGFAACFDKLWDSAIPWHLLQHFASARQLGAAGLTTLCQSLRQAGIRFQQRRVQAVLDWAQQAAPGDVAAEQHRRIDLRFCRMAFQMVAGRQVFHHPAIQGRHYILDKLSAFHRDHDTGMVEVLRDLQAAAAQLPSREYAAEAKPLHEELQKIHEGRRRGPQPLADILPLVLARLGVGVVQSAESGE